MAYTGEALDTLEDTPRFTVESVDAQTIGQAMDKISGGARQKEFAWVLTHQSEARKIFKGSGYYFFPGEEPDGTYVYCVRWGRERFEPSLGLRAMKLPPNSHVVLLG